MAGRQSVAGGLAMIDDIDDDEQPPAVRFTDEEHAFLRHAQYGELPRRIRPDELVELQETEAPRGFPDNISREYWILTSYGGGAAGG
jgi:hypothetical protein